MEFPQKLVYISNSDESHESFGINCFKQYDNSWSSSKEKNLTQWMSRLTGCLRLFPVCVYRVRRLIWSLV